MYAVIFPAPLTRLRRRLSVEQTEESKSPAVNTPTKKRGGRKTKPELEPVDENSKLSFIIMIVLIVNKS